MKHFFSTSSSRNPVFFILVIIIFTMFTMMVASGLRVSSGTLIPASSVSAAPTEPVEPKATEAASLIAATSLPPPFTLQ
jgi:hypothetical protein